MENATHGLDNAMDLWVTQDGKGHFEKGLYEVTVKLRCRCRHESVLQTVVSKRALVSTSTTEPLIDILREALERVHEFHVTLSELDNL